MKKAEHHKNGTDLHGIGAMILLIVAAVALSACEAPARRDYAGDTYCSRDLFAITQACRG
ncbi:MAG: hypothetical protein GEV05_24305 [Betaproteobacteria bacterium]|nr:hypothetical protein [Betaproteobacteria bacterium]